MFSKLIPTAMKRAALLKKFKLFAQNIRDSGRKVTVDDTNAFIDGLSKESMYTRRVVMYKDLCKSLKDD